MLGKTISHYHIKSQLGEGGMGVVYEAEDTNLGRHVALKFLTPSMANDENLLQRFQREARAASSLNHPNICTIHGIEQHESEHFIVMELLDGESLADRISRGPLDNEAVLRLGVQIVDALESAHSKGIVHRDLKPGNILLTPVSRRAKVTDFGLAAEQLFPLPPATMRTGAPGSSFNPSATHRNASDRLSPALAASVAETPLGSLIIIVDAKGTRMRSQAAPPQSPKMPNPYAAFGGTAVQAAG